MNSRMMRTEMIKIIERLCSWFVSESINPPKVETIYDELGVEHKCKYREMPKVDYEKIKDSLGNDSSF